MLTALKMLYGQNKGHTYNWKSYDGWNLIAEYTGGSLSKNYTWGMDLKGSPQEAGGVGGLLAVDETSATYYPTYDGNGNVSEYLDASGGIEAHYEYDAFGNTTTSVGAKSGDFRHRFSTKLLDAETGFYYYGYRYYDPVTGRWPSRDPIQEQGGVNLYGFVRNDGVQRIDVLGLSDCKGKYDTEEEAVSAAGSEGLEDAENAYTQGVARTAKDWRELPNGPYEVGGRICKKCFVEDGEKVWKICYTSKNGSYSKPGQSSAQINLIPGTVCPNGWDLVSWWHTHPGSVENKEEDEDGKKTFDFGYGPEISKQKRTHLLSEIGLKASSVGG